MMQKILVRSISYFLGLFILSFGIDLMILANVGTSAWDALNVGLNKHFGLTIGTWAQIVGIVLIIVIAILKKQRPELFPLVSMFFLGNFIDFHLSWLSVPFDSLVLSYFIALTGLILMAFGIALYLQADFGFVPIDGFVMVINQKTKLSLRMAKTSAEIGALFLAILLGGPVGIGTIFATFLIGPLLQVFFRFFQQKLKLT